MSTNGAEKMTYDKENILAQIIDKTKPSNKVYESKDFLVILDLFPVAEGHLLVVPKMKGYVDILDMPPSVVGDMFKIAQKAARIVKEAFPNCVGVNIVQNNCAAAGQQIFHPHVHVIPRYGNDKAVTMKNTDKMLTEEAAKPMVEQLQTLFEKRPSAPLRKANFKSVSQVTPDSKGVNIRCKVIDTATEVTDFGKKKTKLFEARIGDETGSIILSLKEDAHVEAVSKKDTLVEVRNASVRMIGPKNKAEIRLSVDKFGKVVEVEKGDGDDFEPNTEESANISAVFYESG